MLADLIVDYDWTVFTIIYETSDSLMRLQDIIQIHGPADNPITVRQLPPDGDYLSLLKEMCL